MKKSSKKYLVNIDNQIDNSFNWKLLKKSYFQLFVTSTTTTSIFYCKEAEMSIVQSYLKTKTNILQFTFCFNKTAANFKFFNVLFSLVLLKAENYSRLTHHTHLTPTSHPPHTHLPPHTHHTTHQFKV